MEYIILFWNIIVFALYGFDKWSAIRGGWRISEKTLLITAFFMGGFGAFLGMQIFRHKTKHLNFLILVPLAMLLNLVIIHFYRRMLV